MKERIRVSTKAGQFEKRKREHLEAGYQIEDEQPVPRNGLCSFTAVRVIADNDDADIISLSIANRRAR
jgi:hypothetical protein